MLTVTPQREALARYGLNVADRAGRWSPPPFGGETAGQIFEGDRRFDIVVRLPEAAAQRRRTPSTRLPVPLPGGGYVPLGEVAAGRTGPRPERRSTARTASAAWSSPPTCAAATWARFVAEVQQRMRTQVEMPPGYWLDYGGTFEQLQSAAQRLAIVVPVTLVLILGLLWLAFGSVRDALVIFSGVPLALTGGVLALWLRDIPLSISAGVGFIALSGVAVLNGLVMVSFIKSAAPRGPRAGRGHHRRRPDAPAPGADDGAGGEPRLRADGVQHRHRQRGAAAARDGGDRRHHFVARC